MATVSSFKESHVRRADASWGGERYVKIRIFQTIRPHDGCSSSEMTRYSAMSSPVVFVMSWLCSRSPDEIVSTTEKSFKYRVFNSFENDSSPPLNFINSTFRCQIMFLTHGKLGTIQYVRVENSSVSNNRAGAKKLV